MPPATMTGGRRPVLSTPVLVGLTVVALVAAVGFGVAYVVQRQTEAAGAYVSRDLDGNRVRWPAPPDVAGSEVRWTGERFRAPRQSLSVPLLDAEVTAGVINPPTLTDAYDYRDAGAPGTAGNRVIAMHAVRDGRGPGNAFVDLGPGSLPEALVRRGDVLVVGDERYRVTQTIIEPKQVAAKDPRIWQDEHALVVITCLVDPRVPLEDQQNLVLLARHAR
ncbi:hypothetical protein [Nocardioides sp. NPDC127503]|uniref:hypothetical protein n=1 Tax=Nocardioides sp. NPDC127503 TaxID=3154516 RepID=UPI003324371F